jgi:hypothetical protein
VVGRNQSICRPAASVQYRAMPLPEVGTTANLAVPFAIVMRSGGFLLMLNSAVLTPREAAMIL